MKKVKVVHLISSLEIGGGQAVLYELVSQLDCRRFDQVVVYFKAGPYVQRFQELGVETVQVTGFLFQYDLLFIYRLFWLINYLKPHCIHTVLWAAGIWGRIVARFLKIGLVQSYHNTLEYNGLLRNTIDRISSKWAGTTVAVSDHVAASLKTQAHWLVKPVTVIKNGINVQQIKQWAQESSKSRKDLGLEAHHFVIGAVGRFEKEKQFEQLLAAFAALYDELPDARLVIVGAGVQERVLRQLALDFFIDSRVLFIIDQPAYSYYPLFDCYVSCSVSEGLSMALLEALCFALPCIIAHPNDQHEVIKNNENGLLIPVNSVPAVVNAITKLYQNKDLRKQLGDAGYQTITTQFDAEEMVKQYSSLYSKSHEKKRVSTI